MNLLADPNRSTDKHLQPREDGLIEVGVIVSGPLDAIDRQAITIAIEQVQEYLSDAFPQFRFKVLRIRRPELSDLGRIEPSLLLQQAVEDRDARHWDFSFVLTASELVGDSCAVLFAALSRPLDSAVISMSLIDPVAADADANDQTRVDRISRRISRLMLHALGHLNGLAVRDEDHNLMRRPAQSQQLDEMEYFDEGQLAKQRQAFLEIADQRLEEGSGLRLSYPGFAIRAAWINRREVAEAIWAAKPWQFPRRLSRLTIASVSTIAILFMTAEAWDLGLSQTHSRIALLTALSLITTTVYVVVRQQLLIRRGRQRSEQSVVTATSAFGIVASGMAVTWLTLWLIGLGLGWLLFRPELIANWAASASVQTADVGVFTSCQMSCFAASLGLMIGALGASFESQHYFRHIIFVDEEI